MSASERPPVAETVLAEPLADKRPRAAGHPCPAVWERIVSHVSCLGPLPGGVLAVHRAVADPNATAGNVAAALGADQALAAAVLRLANSAYFGPPRRVSSLLDAVVLLGFDQIRTVTYTVWTSNMLRVLPRIGGLTPALLWRHSLGTAISARQLAMAGLFVDPDTAFTAGVLHDMGSVVLRACAPGESLKCLNLARERGIALHEAEQELLGATHSEAGAFMLSRWQLPPALVEVAGGHHQPAHDTPWVELISIVHIADHIASAAGYSPDGLPAQPVLPKALELLHLDEESL